MALTLRHKLLVLYTITISAPLIVILFILPYFYQNLFNQQSTELYEGTLNSLTSNVEMYLDELERLTITPYFNNDVMVAMKLKANNHFDDASPYSKLMAERSIRYTLPNQLKNTRKDILGTILILNDGSIYANTKESLAIEYSTLDFPYKEKDWYVKALNNDGKVAYISSHPQDYFNSNRQVFSVARLLKDPDSGKNLGVIMADADNSVIENIIQSAQFKDSTIVTVLDENQKPLYSNSNLDDNVLGQLKAGKQTITSSNDTYRVVKRTMSSSDWSIVVLFSNQEFQSNLVWLYRIGTLFAIGGIVLTMLLNVLLIRWVVNPFKGMVRVMHKVKRGDLSQRFYIKGKDEIAQLGSSLNIMISQLQEMIDREYSAELKKRHAELRALQSQIQPHFLYNTLNGLIGLNRSGQHRVLEKAIFSLSGMLRYTLEHDEATTIGKEMAFLQQYCELQQLRFGDRFKFTLEFDSSLSRYELPKLILQPLVENAIIHGIEPLSRLGILHVTVHLLETDIKKHMLYIRIEDNGLGFETADSKFGIGINNVGERLLLFDNQAKMDIKSERNQGALIELYVTAKEVLVE